MAAVLLAAAALRLLRLDFQPLWWDEGWSVYFANLSIPQMLNATAQDIHPPLYYILLHILCRTFGYSPLVLRLLSAFFGISLIFFIIVLGSLLLGKRWGLLVGFIAAISPMQVFYSQEVRMYALLTALAGISWLALLRTEQKQRRNWHIVYIFCTALALYTEYYAVLILAGQCLYLLIRGLGHPKKHFLAHFKLPAIALAAYLPWLIYALPRLIHYVANKQSIEGYHALDPFTYVCSHLIAFASGQIVGTPQPSLMPVLCAIPLLALALIGCFYKRTDPRLPILALSSLLLPLTGGFIINLLFPFTPRFYERVMLFSSPVLYLTAVAGVMRLWRTIPPVKAVLVIALFLPAANLYFYYTVPRYPEQDYRPLFKTIQHYGNKADVILCVHPWQYGYASAYLPTEFRHPYYVPVDAWQDSTVRREQLSQLLSQNRAVWFPSHQSLGRILEDEIGNDLDTLGYEAASEWYGQETLLLAYVLPKMPLSGGQTATFVGGPALVSSNYSAQADAGSGYIAAQLSWQPEISAESSWQLSLRLIDDAGTVWAARDAKLNSGQQHLALFMPWGIPATSLTLAAVVSNNGQEFQPDHALAGQFAAPLGPVQIFPAHESAPNVTILEARPIQTAFANGLMLVGKGPLPQSVKQGEYIDCRLWWSVKDTPVKEYILFLQAVTKDGRLVAAAERRITNGIWPMTNWPSDTLIYDRQQLLLPASAPAGTVRLIAGLLDPETRQPVAVAGNNSVSLGQVSVQTQIRQKANPSSEVTYRRVISFEPLAQLIGYDLEGCASYSNDICQPQDNDTLKIRLLWQAQNETDRRYRSFAHLTCGSTIVAQSVQQPGDMPTTAWLPDQFITDTHTISLIGTTCQTEMNLYIGLYDPTSGVRIEPSGEIEKNEGRALLFRLAPH